MSAHTMYITTCNICEKIGNVLQTMGSYILGMFESAGKARAAAAQTFLEYMNPLFVRRFRSFHKYYML
jgi:hypothetical protein